MAIPFGVFIFSMLATLAALVSIWTFRLVRWVLLKVLSRRWPHRPHWSLVPIFVGFSLGLLWGGAWGGWVGEVVVGCFATAIFLLGYIGFVGSLFIRPILILGKDKFSVSLVEALECFLCFSIVAFNVAYLAQFIRIQ